MRNYAILQYYALLCDILWMVEFAPLPDQGPGGGGSVGTIWDNSSIILDNKALRKEKTFSVTEN